MRFKAFKQLKLGTRWLVALAFAGALLSLLTLAVTRLMSPVYHCFDCVGEQWIFPVPPDECSFSAGGLVTIEGKPAERLLIGLSFTARRSTTHVKTVTDVTGRFLLVDPGPEGCFGRERYISVEDNRYLLVAGNQAMTGRNLGPVESGSEVVIDLVPFRVP